MSSLKFIMDVDMDPLESHASYQRSREAAGSQASSPTKTTPTRSLPPGVPENEETMLRHARSMNQMSMPMIQQSWSSHPSLATRHGEESTAYPPDYRSATHRGSRSAGPSGAASKESDPALDIPVKYTPVTGRVSKAKKGVPVHTCSLCRPPKTFTRAEHLRRHQKSHQDPTFTCTYENCEKAFHRPDLLARHISRHEIQGEEAYKSADSNNRASSGVPQKSRSPTISQTPQRRASTQGELSASDSSTPTTTAPTSDGHKVRTATSFGSITRSFQAVNFSHDSTHNTPTSAYPQGEPQQIYRTSMENAPLSSAQPAFAGSELPRYVQSPQPGSNPMYGREGTSALPLHLAPAQDLPHLKIPDQSYIPHGLYTRDGPYWVPSTAGSVSSVQSDSSERTRRWGSESQSASTASVPSWSVHSPPTQWSTPVLSPHLPAPQNPSVRAVADHLEDARTPPRTSTPGSTQPLVGVVEDHGVYNMESAGTPAVSAHNRPLSQVFSASSLAIADHEFSGVASPGSDESTIYPLGTLNLETLVTADPKTLSQLDEYFSSFWQHFNPLFPIIHRATFTPWHDVLLSSAIAAIGCQYHDCALARQRAIDLHEICRTCLGVNPKPTLATMQAILLYEVFRRFRGRKTTVRFSRQFEELYAQLRNHSYKGTNVNSNIIGINTGKQDDHYETEWKLWVDNETQRRLLAGCYIFDIHQAMYHEQPRLVPHFDLENTPVYVPSPEPLWECGDASEWEEKRFDYPSQPLRLLVEQNHSQSALSKSPFSQWLYICYHTANLPARERPFPNQFLPYAVNPTIDTLSAAFPYTSLGHMYLALYHTPLQDLLAVAGETWVFSKKLTPPKTFDDARVRLRSWASSLAAASAAHHACIVLQSSLLDQSSWDQRRSRPRLVSEYWSLYTATLICWAFGHRCRHPHSLSISTSHSEPSADSLSEHLRRRAFTYTKTMLQLSVEDLVTNKATMRGDTSAVMETVRAHLQEDAANGRCMMLVDAVCVLDRIREGGNGRWF
ncbi:fungal-specific transcription factor domain-containing protein [Xylogone sp. PMI_703]|nr:fungal-specific transcription factor domain-containing protein [Xylogone sp. PMI_703]